MCVCIGSRQEIQTLPSAWLPNAVYCSGLRKLNICPFCAPLNWCIPITPVAETCLKILPIWFILSCVSGCFQFIVSFKFMKSLYSLHLLTDYPECAWDPREFHFQCSSFPLNSVLKMPHPWKLESQLHTLTHIKVSKNKQNFSEWKLM